MRLLLPLVSVLLFGTLAAADEPRPKRLLLIGQGPDNHAWGQHEYMAGQRILAGLLQDVPGVQAVVVNADEPWADGPELLDGADGAVVFVSEGAKWLSADPQRLAAFRRLAERKGGIAVLHWGMGTKEAGPIEPFVDLFGACHGGPDRKYKVVTATLSPAKQHPVTRGLEPLEVHEEFYYALKTPPGATLVPLLTVPIDGEEHMVGWAWERPDGGRSLGFSGLHFHSNWGEVAYRRFVVQGVLWTVGVQVPETLSLAVDEQLLAKPRPKPAEKAE